MTMQVNPHSNNMEQRISMQQRQAAIPAHKESMYSDQTDLEQFSYDNLQRIHSNHMDNGTSFIAATPELVDMLGGIDQILSDYLNAPNQMLLNSIQRQRIYQVLRKPPLQDHKNQAPKDYTYLFLVESTSINLCCAKEKAQQFMRFVFHKLSILFYTVLGLVLLIFKIGIKHIEERIWFSYYQCAVYSLSCIWLLFALLLANKSALCVVAKTFEFVLKLFFTMFAIFMEYIWYFEVNSNHNDLIQRLVVYISWIAMLLIIILFSALDALYVTVWIKTYIGFVVAVIFVVHTWNISMNDADDVVEIVGTSISLGSLAVSSFQFVLLFVIKQSILSILKRDKIISVKSSPYVRWVNDIEK
eukprot:23289_1